jgi:glycosyltransferase involved in cell wall biosynthesis
LQNIDVGTAKLLNTLGFLLYSKLDESNFRSLYSQIQTVLVPSLWNEPWPYVVIEAIMQRRLVIASRIGGIPEQVEGCKGAFLCEPGDCRQLADTMEMVSGLNIEELNDIGSQSREVFLRRFNNESSIRKFINICEHLA